jgi:hypothetical protein
MNYKGFSLLQDGAMLLDQLKQLLVMEYAIRRRALPAIVADIRRDSMSLPTPDAAAELLMMDKIWRGCGFWLRWLFFGNRPCLRRSLVLFRWRLRHGLPAKLLVGVDRQEGDLKGHAWLEIAGEAFREDETRLKDYVVMLEFEQEAVGPGEK